MEKDIFWYRRGAGSFSVEEQNIQRAVEKRLMNILVIGNGFDLLDENL